MKYFKIALIPLFFAGWLFFSSCSSSTSPVDEKNYFSLATNNYWVYDVYGLDSLGNKDLSTKETDSTVITGSQVVNGKNAFTFTTYNNQGNTTENYYTENGKLYTLAGNVMPDTTQMPIPLNIPNEWVCIANPDSSSWSIFSQSYNNVAIQIPNMGTGKISGTFVIKGEKGVNQTINTGENGSLSVQAQEYKLIYSFTGTITITVVPIPLNLNFNVTTHNWYGLNIGLVLTKVDPTTISAGGLYSQRINGSESNMIRYHINK